jgi:hypothetical protein
VKDINPVLLNNTLIALKGSPDIKSQDEKQSNVGRFISRTFRGAFLKEKNSKDSPLKAYEIAEAGVTGLNKLLGWQMALNVDIDENGGSGSVNFSSKLVKFNIPVKKADP